MFREELKVASPYNCNGRWESLKENLPLLTYLDCVSLAIHQILHQYKYGEVQRLDHLETHGSVLQCHLGTNELDYEGFEQKDCMDQKVRCTLQKQPHQ